MKKAFYMRFIEGASAQQDRVGGLPTHLPPVYPVCPESNDGMGFLMQIYTDNERLRIEGILCIQLYQCIDVDDGGDPFPYVVTVPHGAEENAAGIGICHPGVRVHGIEWETRYDPDEIPMDLTYSPDILNLYKSKAAGATPFLEGLPKDARVIFQLSEKPVDFNFGGLLALVYLDSRDKIKVALL